MLNSQPSNCPHCRKAIPPACPHCGSNQVKFNGRRASSRQQCKCLAETCGRQFTAGSSRISPATWKAADVLLDHQVDVKVISQALGISRRHLYTRRELLG